MSIIRKTILFSLLLIGLTQCNDCNDEAIVNSENTTVQQFIWDGLNGYYLWQEEVPALSDSRKSNPTELTASLTANTPEDTFESLLYQRGTVDRFSFMINDYTILEELLSGTSATNGMDYGLNLISNDSDAIFAWVRYVLPNSDAETKGVKRGMIIHSINNTKLTTQNYSELFDLSTYTIQLANYNWGIITPINQEITLSKTTSAENPIHINKVLNVSDKRIGYLMYNSFYHDYNLKLNEAFGELKTQNITDLVLDLRYNRGGSVISAQLLASLITGQFTGQVFAKEKWNSKIQELIIKENGEESLITNFVDNIDNTPLNSIKLNTVYILTSQETASASELIINGLKPHINVIQIGETTTGKNVGSVTLYDSRDFRKEDSNPNHKYALQPLVLKIANAADFSEYQSGIEPTHSISEDRGNLGILGDEDEPLLKIAIDKIVGIATKPTINISVPQTKSIPTKAGLMHLDQIPNGLINPRYSEK